MIDIRVVLNRYTAKMRWKIPPFFLGITMSFLKRIMQVNRIHSFFMHHRSMRDIDLIDEIFDELQFQCLVSPQELERIPVTGKLICIANHPLGGLDGLAIVRTLKKIRPDVRIVVNNVLMMLDPLQDLFIPVDVISKKSYAKSMKQIGRALENEEAVVFFPAGEVSRLTLGGIQDRKWQTGAAYASLKYKTPILPVYVYGKNSLLFYVVSLISKSLSLLLLPHEMFNKRSRNIRLAIGDLIMPAVIDPHPRMATNMLRAHVERIGRQKPGIFKTEKSIIHPLRRDVLRNELAQAIYLGSPAANKHVYLATYYRAPAVIREIARLRETTFRSIGEGTGKRLDMDEFDFHYQHLVLWDSFNQEIVGAYRLGICKEILPKTGIAGLYTSTLFRYSDQMIHMLPSALELGRSFIQEKYWKSHALEYLWGGIGAVLSNDPSLRYLFGAVSISNTYPEPAREALVHVYTKWFPSSSVRVQSRTPS